jgi:putative ABC transport system permease protein
VAAYVGVRALGPAPDVESSSVTRAGILATIGLLVAIGIVAAVGAMRADALVDQGPPRRRRFTLPWEVVPVLLAAIAFARLDRAAGVRIVGTTTSSGDGLGDAFPAFALLAVGAVAIRPLRWLFTRARHGGGRLSPAALLGWRRLGSDPGRHAVLSAVVAAGVGATIVASSLGLTLDRMVHDKATTFLGADLRVVTAGEPEIPAGLDATPISRVAARAAGNDVQVVGIDPDTFAGAVYWREDASDYPLDELLSVLEADDMRGAPLPAIVVGGPVAARTLTGDDGVRIDINAVATARFFPGKTSAPLVIVNRDALAADEVPAAAEIWLRNPPPDATRELAAAGNLVRGSQGLGDVFDRGSVQAVRWAGHTLWAFAAFLGGAALVGALHIAAARRRERQAGRAFDRQLGEPAHQELVAALLSLGLPALLGALLGMAGGALTMRLLADQLDPVGNLPPSAHIVYDLTPAVAAAGVALVLVVVAAVASRALVGRRATGEVIARVQHA